MHKNWIAWHQEAEKINGLSIKTQASLKHKTSFLNQSLASYYVTIEDREALKHLILSFKQFKLLWKKDWDVLGKGSNVLFQDQGYQGCIVDLSKAFSSYKCIEDNEQLKRYSLGGGLANIAFLNHLRKEKLKGFGYAFGIPGSIGGGVVMNAGTPQGWFAQNVKSVEGFLADGQEVQWEVSEQDFEYRHFKKKKDLIVTQVEMVFEKSDCYEIEEEIEQAKNKRKNQPLHKPNFGSVFKNPLPEYAGQLIEASDLKGSAVGGAKISEQHANFIVNEGDAKCSDALALMDLMKKTVLEKFQIQLEQEVIVMGEL